MEMPQLAKETSALAKHKEFLWLKQGKTVRQKNDAVTWALVIYFVFFSPSASPKSVNTAILLLL